MINHSPDLRLATPGDIAGIVRLINDAYRPERFYIDQDRVTAEQIRELLQRGKFLVLAEGTALLGTVYIEYRGERGYLGLLAVDPTRQGGGLGKRLIVEAEQDCCVA